MELGKSVDRRPARVNPGTPAIGGQGGSAISGSQMAGVYSQGSGAPSAVHSSSGHINTVLVSLRFLQRRITTPPAHTDGARGVPSKCQRRQVAPAGNTPPAHALFESRSPASSIRAFSCTSGKDASHDAVLSRRHENVGRRVSGFRPRSRKQAPHADSPARWKTCSRGLSPPCHTCGNVRSGNVSTQSG